LLIKLPFFGPNGAAVMLIQRPERRHLFKFLVWCNLQRIGFGLVYRARGTSGGSDILARILNHWRGISMTQSYLLVDTA